MFWCCVLQVLMALFLILVVLPVFIAGLITALICGMRNFSISG